jgi:hypothetical protein
MWRAHHGFLTWSGPGESPPIGGSHTYDDLTPELQQRLIKLLGMTGSAHNGEVLAPFRREHPEVPLPAPDEPDEDPECGGESDNE